ncbi:MAG: hypothetical protein R2856_39805 [Caldilineaceae bacterium]
MPVNVSAIVMYAPPGAELSCRAHERDFFYRDEAVRHGIISHYAAAGLYVADTMQHPLRVMERTSDEDLQAYRLVEFYHPSLQLIGPANAPLVGKTSGVDH